MTNTTTTKTGLAEELNHTSTRLLSVLEKFDESTINEIPFTGSWTAAQVADHVTKSNRSISKALLLKETKTNRSIDERVSELKNIFLDFNTKLNAPEFIIPDNGAFDKEVVIANLAHSIGKIKIAAETMELSAIINHPIFGDITKYEVLHFVLYHTQRHIHQLENIYKVLKKHKPKQAQ